VSIVANKKSTCDRVRRALAGKTRDEIMDAICAEFDLPRPAARTERSDAAPRRTPAKAPKKVKL
jgi:hypothetical protein